MDYYRVRTYPTPPRFINRALTLVGSAPLFVYNLPAQNKVGRWIYNNGPFQPKEELVNANLWTCQRQALLVLTHLRNTFNEGLFSKSVPINTQPAEAAEKTYFNSEFFRLSPAQIAWRKKWVTRTSEKAIHSDWP